MTGIPGRGRTFTISLSVWIQYTSVTDGRTDGRTHTGRQLFPRLRIASRGNNLVCARVPFNLVRGNLLDNPRSEGLGRPRLPLPGITVFSVAVLAMNFGGAIRPSTHLSRGPILAQAPSPPAGQNNA